MGRFQGFVAAEPRAGESIMETNARVLNGQKHRLSWDVTAPELEKQQ
jgi:hypothetical protein